MVWIFVLLLLFVLPLVGLATLSALSQRPKDLGVVDGRLRPCPDKPNCVCTFDRDPEHTIQPLFLINQRDHWKELQSIVQSMPGARIVSVTEEYMHVEFTSRLFRFVDDVEFQYYGQAAGIHFRSASRAGYSDLGANRARMEEIRRRFEEAVIPNGRPAT